MATRAELREQGRKPPLVLTKLHPPPRREQTVLRNRLVDRLRPRPGIKLTVVAAPNWGRIAELTGAFARSIVSALEAVPVGERDRTSLVMTAHSLPLSIIEAGDPYAKEVAATAALVAGRAGIAKYECAFQSAGRTPEPWIGPELLQVIDDRSVSLRKFLVVPIGFVCDHTEILFDIDIQAAQAAREFSTTLRRTESLNTSPLFIATLEDLVRTRVTGARV